MTKATPKAKPTNNTESYGNKNTQSNGLDWIPSSSPLTESKKQDNNISTILELKFISCKLDKFGRNVVYFSISNPEALNVIKENIDNLDLNLEQISLPFWSGTEGEILIRVGKQNCSLTDEQLQESSVAPLKVPCDFRYYTGKAKKNGYSVYI